MFWKDVQIHNQLWLCANIGGLHCAAKYQSQSSQSIADEGRAQSTEPVLGETLKEPINNTNININTNINVNVNININNNRGGKWLDRTQVLSFLSLSVKSLMLIALETWLMWFYNPFMTMLVSSSDRWSLVENLKLNFGWHFEVEFWSRFWGWSLVEILKANFGARTCHMTK